MSDIVVQLRPEHKITCKCCGHERTVYTGSQLKAYRNRHQLSLKQVSKELGMSVSFISDCEHDRRNSNDKITHYWQMKELKHMVFRSQ